MSNGAPSSEGNVFSRVCLPMDSPCTGSQLHPLPVQVTTSADMFKLVQGPSWTCSNLFNLDLAVQQGLPDMVKLVHYVACTVGKWAVGIQLKCLLVKQGNLFKLEAYILTNVT